MWFKSDIAVYDREDFQMAWEECSCLGTVWEWIQRESVKQEQETICIRNNLQLRGVLKKLHISEAEFRDAQKLLGELELIVFDEPNIITLPNWLLKQGSYFAEKERNAARKAQWRVAKKAKSEQDVPETSQNVSRMSPLKSREEIEKENTASSRACSPINVIPIKSNTLSEEEVYFELKKLGYPATVETDDIATRFVEEMKGREWCDAKGAPIRDVIKYLKAKFAKEKQHA